MFSKIFKHQFWNLLVLVLLLYAVGYLVKLDIGILEGSLWGIDTYYWLLYAILVPILHQLYVLLCWRLELHEQAISKKFGAKGFKLYKIGFTVLIISRPISLILLAISNANTLDLDPGIAYFLSAVLFIPAAYLFYSIRKYFGYNRAFGIDHFEPEKYRDVPFVKKGIFKYTSNGMYVFGFMALYIPGLIALSKAALLAALFNHIYIWCHHYFTELPDIKVIYGDQEQD